MYVQNIFEETRTEVLHGLMCDHPMASLVMLTPNGLDANNLPIEVDATRGPLGTLRCHVGKMNPCWRDFSPDLEAMVIFQGPNAYISPSWYVNGQKSGKVLPSWNYAVVHAYGTIRVMDDDAWLMRHLGELARRNETGREKPWQMQDAPEDFVKKSAEFIVGLEITITRLIGKWFVSQQRTAADRESVSAALLRESKPSAAAVAALIRRIDSPD
jgi:transcriptional regulator